MYFKKEFKVDFTGFIHKFKYNKIELLKYDVLTTAYRKIYDCCYDCKNLKYDISEK